MKGDKKMTKHKKFIVAIIVIIIVLITIHVGVNYIVPCITSMHQGMGQY